MPYIERWPEGGIKGVFSRPQLQPDGTFTTEPDEVSDEDPEVIAFLQGLNIRRGNALPLILQSLHSRIEALEGRALAEDEDPGEQPEIFTEEDVEAAGAVAASEPELEAFEPSLAASAPELAAYPGIMPLRNELEDLRSDVIRAISDQKRMRLRVAMDPSRADFLSERFAQYNNAGALGIEPDEGLIADRNAFLAMQSQERAINAFALSLEDAAATADEAKLRAMHAGLGDGWP